jgi:ring-1,2-phenylacetyl-CoA epoxidase subunit PaaD
MTLSTHRAPGLASRDMSGVAGSVGAPASCTPDEAAVWAILDSVPDPEIPTVSVVDLGVIGAVVLTDETVRVEILPTFVGCPAIEMMQTTIAERLAGIRATVEVEVSFAEPWTSQRISLRGRERLRASGFAPPEHDRDAGASGLISLVPRPRCPLCGGRRTRLDNAFGPTLCRSIAYCLDCRAPFEQFKTV